MDRINFFYVVSIVLACLLGIFVMDHVNRVQEEEEDYEHLVSHESTIDTISENYISCNRISGASMHCIVCSNKNDIEMKCR